MEDDDDFFDTVSVNSAPGKRRFNSREYLGLSRNTVYHSIMDLDNGNELEMGDLDQKKVPNKSRVVNTYEQWKNRRWRYFSSSNLSVDYVLAYDDQGDNEDVEKRTNYEHNLETNGLILEREENQRIHFVKIHVPKDVVMRYAEILKLRLPIKDDEECPELKDNIVTQTVVRMMKSCKVSLDPGKFPPKKYQLTAEFNKDKDYLFNVDDPDFFNTSVKITVISYILEREKFGNEDQDKGIKRLIAENVYKAAYPLHDGDLHDKTSIRKLLLDEWASVSKCIKYQPLDDIKDYFGVKCAIYFAWLGFYTHMLIPASVVGILCLIYGALTLQSDILSRDICNAKNITMCPRCDKYCDYWYIQESCGYSKIQHVIDNNATIFFAVFMSFWGTLYLEMWKRYSAEIAHRWGLTGFDLQAEPPRPEYLLKLANAKKKKLNVITQLQEPVVPFWRVKLPSIIISFSVAFCWTLIALSVVVAVVVYRMSSLTSGYLHSGSSYKIYAIPVTAGLINLTCIHILNFLYGRLAETLTELELQRTQNEFDESLAIKIYMFQFVNFYSSIFYIAFIKGKFVGYPAKYNRVFGYRQEECNPGGCLMELTIQLAIIMIGNQAINAVMEMSLPVAMKMYKTFIVTTGMDQADKEEAALISCNQWTEDYKLSEIESKSLYSEYLEMVLQYGFVTIFVTAFPLAPLFALINNILEMRLDAKKFLKYYRRPVPQRVKNIGVWYSILAFVGRLAVVSNAFIIAFSSHFIPKLVYKLKYAQNFTEEGYMEHSLAFFNTSHFSPGMAPLNSQINATVCRYSEYRNHYTMDDHLRYKRPLIYWHILAARLAFVVVYQNLVSFVMTAVEWMIPDVSRKLNDRIKREAYRTNEIIIHNETRRARERKASSMRRKRDSMMSTSTVYFDAVNGDVGSEGDQARYYDVNKL